MIIFEAVRARDCEFLREMDINTYGAIVDVMIELVDMLGQALDTVPDYDKQKAA